VPQSTTLPRSFLDAKCVCKVTHPRKHVSEVVYFYKSLDTKFCVHSLNTKYVARDVISFIPGYLICGAFIIIIYHSLYIKFNICSNDYYDEEVKENAIMVGSNEENIHCWKPLPGNG
jgi:hypothetical protein